MKNEFCSNGACELLVKTYDGMITSGFVEPNLPNQLMDPLDKVSFLIRDSDFFVSLRNEHNGNTWAIAPHIMLARIAVLTADGLDTDRVYQKVVAKQAHQIILAMCNPDERVAYIDNNGWRERVSFAQFVMTGHPDKYVKKT